MVKKDRPKHNEQTTAADGDEGSTDAMKPGMQPHPPKPPMTAFFRFRNEKLPEYRKKMHNRTIMAITETIADAWIKLSTEERSPYEQKYQKEKKEYEKEFEEFERDHGETTKPLIADGENPLEGMYYNSSAGAGQLVSVAPSNHMKETARKSVVSSTPDSSKDKAEDSNKPPAPRRPQTSFFQYKNDVFDQVKEDYPSATGPEITSIISEDWKGLSDKEKKIYEDKYKEEKEHYDKEIEQYEKEYGPVKRQKKRSAPVDAVTGEISDKKPKLSQYEMGTKSKKKGAKTNIIPDEGVVGKAPKDESRQRKPYIPPGRSQESKNTSSAKKKVSVAKNSK